MDFPSVADNVSQLGINSLYVHPKFNFCLTKENAVRARLKGTGNINRLDLIGSPVSKEACREFLSI